jgi:carbonic anhydrase
MAFKIGADQATKFACDRITFHAPGEHLIKG